ncbi:hypothetical protein ACFFVF_10560 [Flavobacterium jumunjinense]|uniref:Uncharacterized protein n=1 Tax=Flavobacterium jumunjinense TaxID=998845 RepID=A0ABV5GNJ5_9FLAO|nr:MULTISPECIES: hypothetical protein [Flavobacterium]
MKKGLAYLVMILGFAFSMVSCTTDAYDVQEDTTENLDASFMNKDGDGVGGDDGTTDQPEGDNAESTDPIVKPKRD